MDRTDEQSCKDLREIQKIVHPDFTIFPSNRQLFFSFFFFNFITLLRENDKRQITLNINEIPIMFQISLLRHPKYTRKEKKKKERNVSVDTIQYIPAEDLLYISSLE